MSQFILSAICAVVVVATVLLAVSAVLYVIVNHDDPGPGCAP